METVLLFHEGIDLPCFAAFPLVDTDTGRAALRRYYRPFLDLARDRGTPFVLDAPTWRANPDWGARLGYDTVALGAANRRAVAFAAELASRGDSVLVNGVVGPRAPGERVSADAAADYHAW